MLGRVLFRNIIEFVVPLNLTFISEDHFSIQAAFFQHLISDFSPLQELRKILSCKCPNSGKMCYCKYMSTYQAWIDRTRCKHRFHVSSFPSFSFPSFFPSFLPAFLQRLPLPALTPPPFQQQHWDRPHLSASKDKMATTPQWEIILNSRKFKNIKLFLPNKTGFNFKTSSFKVNTSVLDLLSLIRQIRYVSCRLHCYVFSPVL